MKATLRLITLISLVLTFCLQSAVAAINTSPNDDREYLSFTLENQLKVVVISDPDSKKAAASLDVDIGSRSNPEDRQGLAHFLEHMLFLGTEKYPTAGEYKSFISSHGGSHNAYTSMDNTNYFFDIRADSLEPALDRFAQFFVAPLFTEQYVDRERNAVHSEYQSKLREDGRRIFAAMKQVMNPANSSSRFAVGSLETLANRDDSQIRDELIQFYNQYYSANLMTLVVLGNEPVEQLKTMVESRFGAVKNHNTDRFVDNEPMYLSQQLPAKLKIQTLKDIRYLTLSFPVDSIYDLWREKPLYYIASMVGYEGEGSLLSVLKARGLASGLSASPGHSSRTEATFSVNIALTEQGLKEQDQVVSLFFQAINQLRSSGVKESLFNEEKQLNALRFQFKEPSEPVHYVGQLARALQKYPAENIIDFGYTFGEFKPALIDRFLQQITPANMLMIVQAKDLTTDKKEPWFGANYGYQQLTAEQLTPWNNISEIDPDLKVRKPNPYLAENLSLSPLVGESDKPQQLLDEPGLALWYKQDNTYRIPKADLFFTVLSDASYRTVKNSLMTEIYTRMVQDQLNEQLYDALLAGLNTRIYTHMRGFSVRISGYNDKQPVLLNKVLEQLKRPTLSPERFDILKQQYQEQLENEAKEAPYNQTLAEIYHLLLPIWSNQEKREALASVTVEDLQAFIPELLSHTGIRVLSHGNISSEQAQELAHQVNQKLRADAALAVTAAPPVVRLQSGAPLVQTLAVEHNDSAISVYLQGDNRSLKTRAAYAVVAELLSSPFYNQLRTEDQLGYVVFGTAMPVRRAPGIALVVQSPVADPTKLESRISQFIDSMVVNAEELTDETLSRYQSSVISRILRQENTLSARSDRYWREIDSGDLSFDSRDQLVRAVTELTVSDIRSTLADLEQRRLTVRSFGQQHKNNDSTPSSNAEAAIKQLKQNQAYFPEA